MPDFAVNTLFGARDRITQAFGKMAKGAARFNRAASKAFRDSSRQAERFQNITKGILAAGAVQKGLQGLTRGLTAATTGFIDFEQAAIGATARFKDIGPDAADFEDQLKNIRKAAREAGATTEFTAAQAAAGLDFLARAGFSSSEAMGSLVSMINLATATGEDFARSADIASDLLGSFGLQTDNTAQKIANLNRLNDVLVKTANSANVTLEDMFETMKAAGPVGTKAGASLEEIAALTAAMGNAGIKGGEGATALKNAFLRLGAQPPPVKKALAELGITVDDGTGNMRKFTDILGDVSKGLKGVGEVKTLRVLDALFGKRAIAGTSNILDALASIEKFETVLDNAAGTSERTADRLRKSLGNRIKTLISAATEFSFKIIEAFEVRAKGAINSLITTIGTIDPQPIIEAVNSFITVTKTLWAVIKPFVPFLPELIAMWLTYAAALKVVAIAQAVSGFISLIIALKGTAGAMGILNAVMAANPIGAVIIALTALVGVIVFAIRHFDDIKVGWKIMIGFMKRTFLKWVAFQLKIFGTVIKTIISGIANVAEFLGFDTSGLDRMINRIDDLQTKVQQELTGERKAPNQEQTEARQKIEFEGNLNISGAPEGTTVSSKTRGAPPVDVELLGMA
jgi:TP901 family phage tail tape measure protein